MVLDSNLDAQVSRQRCGSSKHSNDLTVLTRSICSAAQPTGSRVKTASGLHPFWLHQMTMSRRGRAAPPNPDEVIGVLPLIDGIGDRVGT